MFSKFSPNHHPLKLLFIIFLLIISTTSCGYLGGNEREKAIEFFKENKTDLEALILWAQTAERSPWGDMCHQPELPKRFQNAFNSDTALICWHDTEIEIELVAIIPPNGYGYYTYLPSHQSPPITHIGGYSVNCSEKIDTLWFFCQIGIN